jgi:hypothetical protein
MIKFIEKPLSLIRAKWTGSTLTGNFYSFKILIEGGLLDMLCSNTILIDVTCWKDIDSLRFKNSVKSLVCDVSSERINKTKVIVQFRINFRYETIYRIHFMGFTPFDGKVEIAAFNTDKIGRYQFYGRKRKREAQRLEKVNEKIVNEEIVNEEIVNEETEKKESKNEKTMEGGDEYDEMLNKMQNKIDKYQKKLLKLKKLIKKRKK